MKVNGYAIEPRANLFGANLYGANLYGADLYGADLRGADLEGADLYGADLYGANLRGANLRRANLRRANLSGADLREADLPEQLVLLGESVLGRRRWAWLDKNGEVIEIRCGCRKFRSLDEAEAYFLSPGYDGESAGRTAELQVSITYWRALIDARATKIQEQTKGS